MAISFDAYSSAEGYDPISQSHTIGSGSNRILFVGIGGQGGSTASSVQYNSVSMNSLVSVNCTSYTTLTLEVFYLLETDLPSSGSYNVTYSRNGGWICLEIYY